MSCDHEWEEIWDDGVGQRCCVCTNCNEERVFQYNPTIRALENKVDYLESLLQEYGDVLNTFAQFANIPARQHEYVTISVNINALREAKRLIGTRFRDMSLGADIPL